MKEVGGGGVSCLSCGTAVGLAVLLNFSFFIRNVPKHFNCIMNYLDSQICVSKCILQLYRSYQFIHKGLWASL